MLRELHKGHVSFYLSTGYARFPPKTGVLEIETGDPENDASVYVDLDTLRELQSMISDAIDELE